MSGKGWNGLVAQLNAVQIDTEETTPMSAPTVETVATPSPATPSPAAESRRAAPPRRKKRATFADTHHLVGVYFPFDIENRFRAAAEQEGISNSELVVRAVSEYLERHAL